MKLQDLASVRSGLVLSRKQAKEPSAVSYTHLDVYKRQVFRTEAEGKPSLNRAHSLFHMTRNRVTYPCPG